MNIGDTKEITASHGRLESQNLRALFVYKESESCYWYSFDGSSMYHACDTEPQEGCDAEMISDLDCFTHSACLSEDDLRNKVDS